MKSCADRPHRPGKSEKRDEVPRLVRVHLHRRCGSKVERLPQIPGMHLAQQRKQRVRCVRGLRAAAPSMVRLVYHHDIPRACVEDLAAAGRRRARWLEASTTGNADHGFTSGTCDLVAVPVLEPLPCSGDVEADFLVQFLLPLLQ